MISLRSVVAAFLMLLIWPLAAISTPDEYTGIITYVYDGDTYCVDGSYYCAGGLQVRAADIDCPELSTLEGIASRDYANQLLLNKRVYLDIDDVTGTDPYGRWICIVYLSNPDGSIDLSSNFNRMLVDSNHACIWDFLNNEFSPSDWWGGYVPAEACLKNGNRPPGTPSRPFGPGSGYTGMSFSYSTSAIDPDKHKVKYTFDWGDGTASQTGLVNSGTSASLTHTWSAVGSYQVKAMATDSRGASSGWSSISTVSITALNRAPATPTMPSGPTEGVSGTAYSYSTSANDPDGDPVKYTFNWGDGTASETNFVGSGTSASSSHMWSSAGTYQIKAMATDNKGASSGWSEVAANEISGLEDWPLYYPDFTDTSNPDSWRSWLVLQNSISQAANIRLELRSRDGEILYTGSHTIPAEGVSALRPRDLVGSDIAGSAIIKSDQPIMGSCQITRNSNEMCMGYNALDHGNMTLYYPDFTDTSNADSWRSWLVLQNPTSLAADVQLEIRSREGGILFSGSQSIPAHSVAAIRPRNLVGSDCAGSVIITSEQPLIGTCQITRNNNKMCMSYTASDHGSTALYYPDFTDTANADSWRSWLVLQNPANFPANINLDVWTRSGDMLYSGTIIIPAHGVNAVRPRSLAGEDCAGSAVVTSDQPLIGTCQITRNSNKMCMSYNALDKGSTALFYPDFTDTADANSWRSWLVLQNPTTAAANITLEIRSRTGDLQYSGPQLIPAHGVSAIRPRNLVGADCSGSVVVTSDQPIAGTCQITRNNNLMCMSYSASG